jgi:hypothetical protein
MAGMMALLSLGVMRMVLRTGGHHVFHRRHLASVVAVGLARAAEQLGALALAAAAAPSFIFTKKGLVSVLVMRPITGSPAASAAPLGGG